MCGDRMGGARGRTVRGGMVFRGGEQVGQTCPGWGLQELPQEGEGGLTTLRAMVAKS